MPAAAVRGRSSTAWTDNAAPQQKTAEERFRQVHSECCKLAQEIIDARVQHLKLCHKDLPEPTLRQDLVKGRYCLCAIANQILDTPA
jgi:hypothetical protein